MKIKRLDRVILLVLALLILSLGLIILIGSLSGVSIVKAYPVDGAQIGPWGKIGVEFGQTMQKDQAVKYFLISPAILGQYIWDKNTLWFVPLTPMTAGKTYSARLAAGAPGADGRQLKKDMSWKFTIRPTGLIYLSPAQQGSELWRKDSPSDQAVKLTDTADGVLDFSVSRDGEAIVYARVNDHNGSDLWLMDRDGASHKLFLNCGNDQCSMPAWSWDGDRIAFSRRIRRNGPASAYNLPRIWTVDVSSGQSSPLFGDPTIAGDSPSWSPGGKYLASYDETHHVLHVLNLKNSKDSIVQTLYNQNCVWSPDGSQFIFANELSTGEQTYLSLYVFDLANEKISEPFAPLLNEVDASLPDWSPDGKSIVVGLRSLQGGTSKQLWVLGFKQEPPEELTSDQIYTYAGFHWNNQGNAIVYQRFELGRSDSHPEVLTWDSATRQAQTIAQNAALPQWLP